MAAGYFGGKTDLIILRFVDAWMAFPSLIRHVLPNIAAPLIVIYTVTIGGEAGS